MVLLFAVGEGPPNPFRQPPNVEVEFFAMFCMVVGFLAGWRWEAAGGLLAIGGFTLFAAAESVAHGKPPHGAILLFALPGLLYVAGSITAGMLKISPRLR
jgi:hypothetical protein